LDQHNYGPVQIPVDHIFVMGDNRNASNDSRAFGAVHVNQIVGRAWLSYWPLDEIGLFE
jgi:signal peptidase I